MSATSLVRYQCHKQVLAAKVKSVREGFNAAGVFSFFITTDGDDEIEVGQAFSTKHSPTAGCYYVVYEDGYASCSPAHAFEAGYTKV